MYCEMQPRLHVYFDRKCLFNKELSIRISTRVYIS